MTQGRCVGVTEKGEGRRRREGAEGSESPVIQVVHGILFAPPFHAHPPRILPRDERSRRNDLRINTSESQQSSFFFFFTPTRRTEQIIPQLIHLFCLPSLCLGPKHLASSGALTRTEMLQPHSPACPWHGGSACWPYRPPAAGAPAWCFRFHPAAGGRACARCPRSTTSSARPVCSGAASYRTGGSPLPEGRQGGIKKN